MAGEDTQGGTGTLVEGVKRRSHMLCLTLAVKPRGRATETSRMIFGNLVEARSIPSQGRVQEPCSFREKLHTQHGIRMVCLY